MATTIYGTEDDDDYVWDGELEQFAGDNVIYLLGGHDVVFAGTGNDVIFCDWGHDLATGDEGTDVLYGEDGDDTLFGGADDDWLVGGAGHDVLCGDEGTDDLFGGSGFDSLNGGDGEDTAHYGDSGSGVIVDLATGTGQGGTAEGDLICNTENLVGSEHDDVLGGDQFANMLHGSGGDDGLKGGGGEDSLWGGSDNDVLFGDDGDDQLWGNTGVDELTGGIGADDLNGGDGIDTATYQGSALGVVASLMTKSGKAGDAAGDFLWGIENLTGSAHADELTGDDDVNTLTGSNGDDTLFGLGDADTLDGGDGSDTLDGGKGIDKMHGGADDDIYIVNSYEEVFEQIGEGTLDVVRTDGTYALADGSEVEWLETTDKADSTAMNLIGNEIANTIIGNAGENAIYGVMGRDVMTGNGGVDGFYWYSTAETAANNNDADVVTDFVAGVDKLFVSPIDANVTNAEPDDQFEFIGNAATNPFTAPGQINFTSDRSNTYIMLNTDGDLDPEAVICVLGSHMVTAGWFIL